MDMKDYGLRGRNEFVPISQEDYEKVRDERNLINKRLQNERGVALLEPRESPIFSVI